MFGYCQSTSWKPWRSASRSDFHIQMLMKRPFSPMAKNGSSGPVASCTAAPSRKSWGRMAARSWLSSAQVSSSASSSPSWSAGR